MASEFKNPKGGLTAKGRAKAKRDEGANLKPGVKNYSSASLADKKRWISWAERFAGQSKLPPLTDDNGKPTRFALSFAAWGEPVPKTVDAVRKVYAKAQARKKALPGGGTSASRLSLAQEDRRARGEAALDAWAEDLLNTVGLTEDRISLGTENVSPSDRNKLKGILKRLAGKAHPFAQCMRDLEKNQPTWSDDRRKRTCATLKALIGRKNGKAGLSLSSEEGLTCPLVDEKIATLLELADISALDTNEGDK